MTGRYEMLVEQNADAGRCDLARECVPAGRRCTLAAPLVVAVWVARILAN